MLAIETSQLSHRFGRDAPVLDNINLAVPRGSIYGFLGPNGAGKTTTLRLLLGLLPTQTGSIRVLGESLTKGRAEILSRIGSSIETPSLYGQLTAIENLQIWQKIYRCKPNRIADVLEIVGLRDTGKKRASAFSLGMRQRLAIAIALLHDPPLLILDEPTNGLDPHGIIEMRDLLLRLNREFGTTILLSSHLLSEIERITTHLGIIHRGRLRFQGKKAELEVISTKQSVLVRTNDLKRSCEIAKGIGLDSMIVDQTLLVERCNDLQTAVLARELGRASIDVYEIRHKQPDLENVFLDLVGAHT
jgi:lantibiotic transport system ATP-binding protein